MKLVHFLPPAVALVLSALWIGAKRSGVIEVQKEIVVLRESIAKARSSTEAGNKALAGNEDTKPVNWKELAEQLENVRRGMPYPLRLMLQLQKQLLAMSEEEILAVLDEVAAWEPGSSHLLESMLVGALSKKNPELTLERLAGCLREKENIAWSFSAAMGHWAGKDPAAATAWMEQQIAAGNFDSKRLDGKRIPLISFESELVGELLKSGSVADAAGRLSRFSEEEKRDVITRINVGETGAKTYAEIVRSSFQDEKIVREVLSNVAMQLSFRGYDHVTNFFEETNASPEERAEAVGQVVSSGNLGKKLDRESVEEMRAWVGKHSPHSQDKLTGRFLASVSHGSGNFSKAAALAVEYHEKSGSDEVLENFLKTSSFRQHKEEARALAEKIRDPALREKILKNFR